MDGKKTEYTVSGNTVMIEVLDLSGRSDITELPVGITAQKAYLTGCTNLHTIPVDTDIGWIDLTGCDNLLELPLGFFSQWIMLDSSSPLINSITSSQCDYLVVDGVTQAM